MGKGSDSSDNWPRSASASLQERFFDLGTTLGSERTYESMRLFDSLLADQLIRFLYHPSTLLVTWGCCLMVYRLGSMVERIHMASLFSLLIHISFSMDYFSSLQEREEKWVFVIIVGISLYSAITWKRMENGIKERLSWTKHCFMSKMIIVVWDVVTCFLSRNDDDKIS